jgi:putative copper export protein
MDGAQVWLRWAQFIDLALVFGVPFTAYLLGERRIGGAGRLVLGFGCLTGLGIGTLGFLVTMAAMMGCSLTDLDRDMVMMMACHSALGWSVLARLCALLIGLILALSGRSLGPLAVVAGVAAASWHGAATAPLHREALGCSGWRATSPICGAALPGWGRCCCSPPGCGALRPRTAWLSRNCCACSPALR